MPIKGRALDLLVDSAVDPIPVILTPKAGHDRHAWAWGYNANLSHWSLKTGLINQDSLDSSLEGLGIQASWAIACKFRGKSGETCMLPAIDGSTGCAVSKVLLPRSDQNYTRVSSARVESRSSNVLLDCTLCSFSQTTTVELMSLIDNNDCLGAAGNWATGHLRWPLGHSVARKAPSRCDHAWKWQFGVLDLQLDNLISTPHNCRGL